MFKIISICILIMVSPSQGYCNNDITLQKTRTVQTIFNDLVAAYGSIKEAPALEIIPLDESHVIAQYIAVVPVVFFQPCNVFEKQRVKPLPFFQFKHGLFYAQRQIFFLRKPGRMHR